MANAVEVRFTAAVGEAQRSIQELGKTISQMAREVGTSMAPANDAMREATKAHGGLMGAMKEFKAEGVSHARMANFYAKEIAGIALAGEGAKKSIAELVGFGASLASGMWILAAVEGIKLLVETFHHFSESAASELETLNGRVDAILRKTQAMREGHAATWFDEETRGKATTPEGEQYQKARGVMEESEKHLKKFEANLVIARRMRTLGVGSTEAVAAAESTVAMAQERGAQAAATLRESLTKLQEARNRMAYGERVISAGGAGPEVEWKKGTEASPDRPGAAKHGKVAADWEDSAPNRMEQGRIADVIKWGQQERAEKVKLALEEMADKQDILDLNDRIEQGRIDGELERAKAATAEKIRLAEAESDRAGKAVEKGAMKSARLGSEIGAVFGEVMSGTADVGDAVAKTGQLIIQSVVQAAIQQVTANAIAAASGAAVSQAPIPIVGPVLALSAMGAMLSAVMGLLGGLKGRAAGGPVSAGIPYLVGERGPELAVFGQDGTVVPNHALGGGGMTVNLHVHSLNGRDAYNALRSNEAQVLRFFRDVRRSGRG